MDISELEIAFQSFNWCNAFYDPLENHIEASTEEDKMDLARMEWLIDELQYLYHSNEEGWKVATDLMQKYWKGHPMEEYTMKKKEHVIPDEAMKEIESALANGKHWVAY